MADIGGWRTVSSVQRLSAGTFGAPVWRNCRHCQSKAKLSALPPKAKPAAASATVDVKVLKVL